VDPERFIPEPEFINLLRNPGIDYLFDVPAT
jgi:hypothetical protein